MELTAEASIRAVLLARATCSPGSLALLAPQRRPLSYAGLLQQVEGVVAWLHGMGVRRDDPVAIVLPSGPEMAVACLGVSAGAVGAPLNPGYRAEQFDFYLSALKAQALIVQHKSNSEAIAAARAQGIPIIELSPMRDAEAGIFTLNGDELIGQEGASYAGVEDTALLLHTSGTTSRRKIVPLTHLNLCSSAENIVASLSLAEADRCLNVMPLFHVHGLVAGLLAPLRAGGSVVCTPGFDGTRFFEWLDQFGPSWYTAVPAIHQDILRRASDNAEIIAAHHLRFIRSSSSSLPPRVMKELEAVFDAPVIEAYGMTEAAHQIASNPLPPGNRKPGSVGFATGCQVAILDKDGNPVPAGQIGEVAIRGQNVIEAYENNPAAKDAAFANSWCRTGDQGVLDEEGYLSLTGRIKEIIDRGGEKVAPREIEDVLISHPGVQQVVVFPVPHPTLGEDIAAAVVPKNGKSLSEFELRDFALQRLPGFKVPTRILILAEIPTGPTGKVQRVGLADRLAPEFAVTYERPAKGLEQLSAVVFGHTATLPPLFEFPTFRWARWTFVFTRAQTCQG